jgi:hypothetical protein
VPRAKPDPSFPIVGWLSRVCLVVVPTPLRDDIDHPADPLGEVLAEHFDELGDRRPVEREATPVAENQCRRATLADRNGGDREEAFDRITQ